MHQPTRLVPLTFKHAQPLASDPERWYLAGEGPGAPPLQVQLLLCEPSAFRHPFRVVSQVHEQQFVRCREAIHAPMIEGSIGFVSENQQRRASSGRPSAALATPSTKYAL